jgi:hypothetical protein
MADDDSHMVYLNRPHNQRITKPTSVMPISVTSHETTEIVTTYVNGRAIRREEKTTVYVIEPVEDRRRDHMKEEDLTTAEAAIERRTWKADMWLGVWALWATYLFYEWRS